MEEIKRRKHAVLDIPILGPTLASVIILLLSEVLVSILVRMVMNFIPVAESDTVIMWGGAFGGFVSILLFKAWFRGEFKGCCSGNFGDKKTKILFAVAAVFVLVIIVQGYLASGIKAPSLFIIGTALMAGLCEESAFRLAPISIIMRKPATRKNIVTALILSTVLFGLSHSVNVILGQSLLGTIVQVLSTMGMGFFFGAIYLRTGNLILTIAFHTIYDILGLMQSAANGAITDAASMGLFSIVLNFAIAGVFIVLGILVIWGSSEEIQKVWDDRWQR